MTESITWQQIERICQWCQNSFLPITKWQKMCCHKCGYSYQNSKKVILKNSKLCARCGKSLLHKNNKAIYCTRTCKSMDRTLKHRGGSRIGTARRMQIIQRDNATCYLCNQVIPFAEIELDHLIPYSRGGDSSPQNLSVSCLSCNRSRGNRIGIEQLHRIRELKESNDY